MFQKRLGFLWMGLIFILACSRAESAPPGGEEEAVIQVHPNNVQPQVQQVQKAPTVRKSRPSLPEVKPATPEELLEIIHQPGAKATLVNAWATWCPPCRREFPNIVKLYQNYKDQGLRVIFISFDRPNDLNRARQFLARQGVDFETYIVTDPKGTVRTLSQQWTGGLPSTMILDASGEQKVFWTGGASYQMFETKLLSVLH